MSLESDRLAMGKALSASRASSFKRDLNAMETAGRKRNGLPPLEPKGALPAKVGVADYVGPAAGSGGGIASPLTEGDIALRTYWSNGYVSSDGLFTLPAIKKIAMTDADDVPVEFNYADPVPVPAP